MNRVLLLSFFVLIAHVLITWRVQAQADAKESKAVWKVIQSSLMDGETVARFVLEPIATRRQADGGLDDSRGDRHMAVWLSQASPVLWIAPDRPEIDPINNTPTFGIKLDLSSTNELTTLLPLLAAYEQVIQTATRQKGWEVEDRLERFEFKGELPGSINSSSETREADTALDAAFLRLQEAGRVYGGSIGKPMRFAHRQNGPNAPAIMFDQGDGKQWATLPEPGALLFTLQNLTELKQSHQTLVTQKRTRKAEADGLLATRRHADETESEARTKQKESEAGNGSEKLANLGQADKELLSLAWKLAENLLATNAPTSTQLDLRQSSKARFEAWVKEIDRGVDPSERAYQSHLSKSLPFRAPTPISGGEPLRKVGTVLSALIAAAETDEREHYTEIEHLAGKAVANSILANYPTQRIAALQHLLESSPALSSSSPGLARAVSLLDDARFLPERVHETVQAERHSVLTFVATESGLHLCKEIEVLYRKMLPHLKAQKAVADYSVDQLNRARDNAELGLNVRGTIKFSQLLLVAGQRDSDELRKLKTQMRTHLDGFHRATGVSYDDGRGWILDKVQ